MSLIFSLFTPLGDFFFPLRSAFSVEGKKRREGREKEMEGTGDGSVDPRIHESGVQRKWLLSSDHWELLNVFSLPEIK